MNQHNIAFPQLRWPSRVSRARLVGGTLARGVVRWFVLMAVCWACAPASTPEGADVFVPDNTSEDAAADMKCSADGCPTDTSKDGFDWTGDSDGICLPDCQGKVCGTDGCGGSCGECSAGHGCQSGTCVQIPCVEGQPCDDLDPCTFEDLCTGEVCAGTSYSCDDGKECTTDTCDGEGDCTFAVAGGYCHINNVCYQAGDLRPANPCEECLPSVSKIGWSKDDSNGCSDGNACTTGDYCSDGECLAGTVPFVCADPGPCKSVVCVAATGCDVSPAPGGCDDGNPCTTGDYCLEGECAAGLTPTACPGATQCTAASCDPGLGCVTAHITGPCDDGNSCTQGEYCLNGTCGGGSLLADCNDNNTCTTDSCTLDGKCVYQWNTSPCNDNNEYTSNDACSKGTCSGTPKTCNDFNICTSDTCDPTLPGGCLHTPTNLPCEDPDPCTLGDICSAGVCVGGIIQEDCDDSNSCTLDSCTEGVGCTYTAVAANCEDGDTCTQGDFCANGQCISGPNQCACQNDLDCAQYEDGNKCNGTLICDLSSHTCKINPSSIKACMTQYDTFCMKNLCEPSSGLCSFKPVNEGAACDDLDGCTADDVCDSGSCTGAPCSSSGMACYFGQCGPQLCQPNSAVCVGNAISICNEDGSLLLQSTICPAGTTCVGNNGSASCKTQVCPPNALVCKDNWVMNCDATGLSMAPVEDCALTSLQCYKGACEEPFLCNGSLCPALPGYGVTCNGKLQCEYANIDPTGWRAWDVWLYVRPGSFQMGSDVSEPGYQTDETPAHTVTFDHGFFIMKYPVTVEQYLACKAEAACTDVTGVDWPGLGWEINWGETPTVAPKHYRPKHPQTGINFDQAGFVCDWIVPGAGVGRIPTEAEYEFAAAGPANLRYPWGHTPEPTCAAGLAAYDDNTLGTRPWSCDPCTSSGCTGTVQVGTKPAGISWLGALDMVGNVRVWTQDWYHSSFVGAPTDGSAWLFPVGSERVLKGSGFDHGPLDLRTAKRAKRPPQSRDANVGARCVRPEGDPMTYVVWPICDPDSWHCKNTVRTKCNATGTELVDQYDCAEFGLVCKEGLCVDEACSLNCAGKECGPNGCGGLCGTCAGSQWCSGLGKCLGDIGLVWKPIPAGTFYMGCDEWYPDQCLDRELPKHSVSISAFELLETEVTQAQFMAVMGTDPSCNLGGVSGPNYPVECVTWENANAFCEAIGGRLPTEAEWEYAARAGTTSVYGCDDLPYCVYSVASFGFQSKQKVKSRQKDIHGLYDIRGNVWEWTYDWFDSGYYAISPAADPSGPITGTARVIRGGAFNSYLEALQMRNRTSLIPTTTNNSVGFRCAR